VVNDWLACNEQPAKKQQEEEQTTPHGQKRFALSRMVYQSTRKER
jgi:hypothetical protein